MNRQDELKHYGVLGMKWGIRRARKKSLKLKTKSKMAKASAEEWEYKSKAAAAKGNVKKAAKYADKASKSKADAGVYAKKAKRIGGKNDTEIANKLYRGNDKATNERIAKMSIGQAFLQSYLLGDYGALNYNKMKAAGYSTGKSAVAGILTQLGDTWTGNLISTGEWVGNVLLRDRD